MRLALILLLLLVIFNLPLREGVTNVRLEKEKMKQRREKLKREGVMVDRSNLYAVNKRPANNKKCIYRMTLNGPEYMEKDIVDLKDYYDAPISGNPGIDGLTLRQRESQDYYKKDKEVQKVTSQNNLSAMYGTKIYGNDIGNWRNIYGEGIIPSAPSDESCFKEDPSYLNSNNWTVARPDLDIYSKGSSETPLTGDIPHSEPLMPWLQDPSLADPSTRAYNRTQSVPCTLCGILAPLQDTTSIYPGTYGGPNRFQDFTIQE